MDQNNQEPKEPKEAIKTFTVTDPISNQERQVPEDLQDLIGHIISFNRNKGKEDISPEMNDLRTQIDQMKASLSEHEENKKKDKGKSSEVEELKQEFQTVLDQLNKEKEAIQSQKEQAENRYKDEKIMNDIQEALAKHDVHNRNQLVSIMRTIGQARLKENIDLSTGEKQGTYSTVLTLNFPDESGVVKPMELSAMVAVEKFLSLDENNFHLKNKLSPGGGSSPGGGMTSGNKFDKQFEEATKAGDLVGQVAAMQAQQKSN